MLHGAYDYMILWKLLHVVVWFSWTHFLVYAVGSICAFFIYLCPWTLCIEYYGDRLSILTWLGQSKFAGTIPFKLLLQLTSVFRNGGLRDRSGTFSYKDHLHKSNVPILAVAGDQDLICPPEAVYGMPKSLDSPFLKRGNIFDWEFAGLNTVVAGPACCIAQIIQFVASQRMGDAQTLLYPMLHFHSCPFSLNHKHYG